MKAYFYKIENGKVVGGLYGTDIPGDPSSTKKVLGDWVNAAPGRSVQVVDLENGKPLDGAPNTLTVDAGTGLVRQKTKAELDADKAADDTDKAQKKTARRNAKQAVLQKLKLDAADIPALQALVEDGNDA